MTISYVSGSNRVSRGGSWRYFPKYSRVAYRGVVPADRRYGVIGLRLMRRCA